MSIAVYPGSFDPFTLGHLDIVLRAARQFDKVIICVMYNFKKTGHFTPDERVELIRRSLEGVEGAEKIEVDQYSGLLVDYARSKGAGSIVKGLRNISDFESELQMADINRRLAPEIETLFMTTKPELAFLSSTIAKELASYRVDMSGLVADAIAEDVVERLRTVKR